MQNLFRNTMITSLNEIIIENIEFKQSDNIIPNEVIYKDEELYEDNIEENILIEDNNEEESDEESDEDGNVPNYRYEYSVTSLSRVSHKNIKICENIMSIKFNEWFFTKYEKSKDKNHYITLSEIFHAFRMLPIVSNLTFHMKKIITKNRIMNEIMRIPDLANKHNSRKLGIRNVFDGFKLREF